MTSLDKARWKSWSHSYDWKWQDIKCMEKAVISQPQSLQSPKISVARRNQFPWILLHEQEGPKPFPPRGCCLRPWNKHRNSMCWVRKIIYMWGYCSSVCSPSMLVRFKAELLNPHWTFSVCLLFGLRAEGNGLQTVQETFYQSAGKTASSLPHPFPWHFLVLLTCSHSSSLLFWIHKLCIQFPYRWEKPQAAGMKHW